MIADISNKKIPGYDLAIKTLTAIGRSSIPVNLVLPPVDKDGKPRPVYETPNLIFPDTVIDALEKAANPKK